MFFGIANRSDTIPQGEHVLMLYMARSNFYGFLRTSSELNYLTSLTNPPICYMIFTYRYAKNNYLKTTIIRERRKVCGALYPSSLIHELFSWLWPHVWFGKTLRTQSRYWQSLPHTPQNGKL